MRDRSATTRAAIRCGYVEPDPLGMAWWPNGFRGVQQPDRTYAGPSVCPGYTTALPEVVEVSRFHLHWAKGALRDRTGGRPRPHVLDMLELLACEQSAVEMHEIETARKKGG